jgi:peptidyl-prolyl cis-trans isomerase SurA
MRRTICLAVLLAGCDEKTATSGTAPAKDTPADEARAGTTADGGTDEAAAADGPEGAAGTATGAPRVLAAANQRMSASHILIAWNGAVRAPATVTRTRDEASALAETVHRRVTGGEDFAKVAKELSDDTSKRKGGALGAFSAGTMVGPFEEATARLAVGEISPVVETPFGFHVIRRDAMLQVHCAQLIVSFAGAERPIDGVSRSKEEARARIDVAKGELDSGTPWEVVVRKYSEGPAKDDGGDLGWFAPGQLMPALDKAAMDLDIGANSPVVESPVGFHVLHRLE